MWKIQDIEVVLYRLRYSKFWIIVVNNKYLCYFSGGGSIVLYQFAVCLLLICMAPIKVDMILQIRYEI